MGQRLDLHKIFKNILGTAETPDEPSRVYFQPPESTKLKFPCIVYRISDISVRYADNRSYMQATEYTVTIIDSNPDSDIPSKVGELPMCSFTRQFVNENRYHTVYSLYY